ncbi:hypothetical protein [Azotobacter salinestris]|uniref:hypothetical protein n=1 Tax=Azotobacter salinestris TaxID=69964 RepID=UPI001266A711|nr:hypothetical protein [Azotobacter salinestris]
MSLDTHQSVYREQLLEHLLIGELLKLSWLRHGATLEVSKASLDRAGHDIVLEANGVMRHVQLKSSAVDASAASQKIHVGLGAKPSGCVIWICFDSATLQLGPFLFFGGAPGEPLPPLGDFRVARHTKANALGVKAERPNIRVIPKGRFRRVESVEALHRALFGI